MNPDSARKSLDSKLANMGYVHPTENNTATSTYMSYSENSGKEYFSSTYDPYSTFNSGDINSSETEKTDNCPVCQGKAMYLCNCSLGDMMCNKGHIWFILKNGTCKIGDPHENDDY
jgi:hypothetical protein